MIRRVRTALLIAPLLVAPARVRAQTVTADAAAGTMRTRDSDARPAFLVTPGLQWQVGQLSIQSSLSYAFFFAGGSGGRATLLAAWLQPLGRGLAIEAAAQGDGLSYPDFADLASAGGQARAIVGSPRFSVYAGGGYSRTWFADGPGDGRHLDVGFTVATPVVTASASVTRAKFGAPNVAAVNDVGTTPNPLLVTQPFTDLQGSVLFAFPGAVVELAGGYRFDAPEALVGSTDGAAFSASATVPVAGRVALVASAGRQWQDFAHGLVGGDFVYGGVRVRASGVRRREPTFETQCVHGRIRLVARVRAERVEVQGDLTGWDPVLLAAEGGGRWAIELAPRDGAGRLLWRVDGGEWTPPPGLSVAEDELGVRAGILPPAACERPGPALVPGHGR